MRSPTTTPRLGELADWLDAKSDELAHLAQPYGIRFLGYLALALRDGAASAWATTASLRLIEGLETFAPGPAADAAALKHASRTAEPSQVAQALAALANALTSDSPVTAPPEPSLTELPDGRTVDWTPEQRNESIRHLRSEGWSFRQLAARFDLSPSTVHQIINKE